MTYNEYTMIGFGLVWIPFWYCMFVFCDGGMLLVRRDSAWNQLDHPDLAPKLAGAQSFELGRGSMSSTCKHHDNDKI